MTEPKKDDWGEFGPEIAELEEILGRLEADSKSLARQTTAAPAADPANLEFDLAASRESVSNLLVRLSRERRDARAALLSVKRRLRSFRRSGKMDRPVELEQELAEARGTIVSLLGEVARRDRRAKAEHLLRKRKTGGNRAASPTKSETKLTKRELSEAAGAAGTIAAHHLDARLRALCETAPADPESLAAEADECRRLNLILRMSLILGSGLDATRTIDLQKTVDARLDLWEPDFRRVRATLIRELPTDLPKISVPTEELDSAIDAMVSRALSRIPRGGIVLVRAEAAEKAPLRFEVQDNGADAPAITSVKAALATGKRMTALETALTRELAERWSGSLIAAPAPNGRGQRMTLVLPTA